MAGLGHLLAAVAFGKHDQTAARRLESVNIPIHASAGGGAQRAAGQIIRRFRRAGVVDNMLAHILRHRFAVIQTRFDLGMGDVAGDDNRTAQR